MFFQPHTYLYYGFVCQRNLYELVLSSFGDNIRTRMYLREILRLRMVTSYKLVYFRLSTIRILPNELVHHVTVWIHSSPPAAPAAATTAHNAGDATVATGGYITRRSQRIAEENEVGRRSRYVFLNSYDFFDTICRILISMIFSNHMRTRNTDSYVSATYTNLYYLCLARIYELVYISAKYYDFVWFPHTNSYISACWLYKFHATNLYILWLYEFIVCPLMPRRKLGMRSKMIGKRKMLCQMRQAVV